MAKQSQANGERVDSITFCLGTLLGAESQSPNLRLRSGDRRIDAGFQNAHIALKQLVDTGEVDLDIRFTIALQRVQGDSAVVRNAMTYLVNQMRMLRPMNFKNTVYGLDLRSYGGETETAFDSLGVPGDFPMWQDLGAHFLERLDYDEQQITA